MNWIQETYKEGLRFGFSLTRKLFSGKSEFQKVEIYDTTHHGRVLLNDDCFMLSERDERIYHEMMVHTALSVHPNARRVLVIGGGDGGTVREVLRHPHVQECVMVEIDRLVVEACREHLPQTASALRDSRLKLLIEDGVQYLREARDPFDVILIDSTDPNGAAQPLFGPEFYQDVRRCLKPDGVVVAQGESVFYDLAMQSTLLKIANPLFDYVSMFNFTNMTYPGGLWSFLWASSGRHPLRDRTDLNMEMFYYNANIHQSAFKLPSFQQKALGTWIKI